MKNMIITHNINLVIMQKLSVIQNENKFCRQVFPVCFENIFLI